MIRRPVVVLATLFAAVVSIALAGCAGTPGTASTAASATPPTLALDQPKDGAEVTAGDVNVTVTTTGLKFVMPSNTVKAGEGHVHFTLDDQPVQMSDKPEYVFKGVTPGAHKLEAELVQNDAKSFDPPVAQTVTFTAK